MRTACDYVHLNPVRARMLKPEERLLSYQWSSFGAHLAAPEHRPGWVRVDRLLGEHGIQQDTAAGRQRFEEWMERRRFRSKTSLRGFTSAPRKGPMPTCTTTCSEVRRPERANLKEFTPAAGVKANAKEKVIPQAA